MMEKKHNRIDPAVYRIQPTWVRQQFEELQDRIGDLQPPDKTNLSVTERLKFYTDILSNRTSIQAWTRLRKSKVLPEYEPGDHFADVGTTLEAIHLLFRGFKGAEVFSLTKRKRKADQLSYRALSLKAALIDLWNCGTDIEPGYPSPFFKMDHEQTLRLLDSIAAGANDWKEGRKPVLDRPTRGDAKRRYFLTGLGDYFDEFYGDRLDSVVIAFANCLFDPISEATMKKVMKPRARVKTKLR